MFDTLQIIFWSVTYLLIVIYGFRDGQMRMPLIACAMNFAWELNALIYSPHWGHVLWIALDVIILVQNMCLISRKSARYIYISLTVIAFFGFWVIFRVPDAKSMLISSFVIDFTMAVEYLICVKILALQGKIPIAVTKLIGDMFALIAYSRETVFVAVTGTLVFILNLLYLSCCLEETARTYKVKLSQRRSHR